MGDHLSTSIGKAKRLFRMFDRTTTRTVIVPLDDSLLAGPEKGLRDIRSKLKEICLGEPNAIMGFPGLFERHCDEILAISGILNLTASTTRSKHTRKVLIGSVEEAVKLGVDGVAVHVNIGSSYESEMLSILGQVVNECENLGMPLVAIMYPRSERDGADYNYDDVRKNEPEHYAELVRHATRVGVELGADLIKTQFTGSADSFRSVIEISSGVPIVIAGGPMVNPVEMLNNAHEAIRAGAAGVSFGRNIYNREPAWKYLRALRSIVHEGLSVDGAMQSVGIKEACS